MRVLLLDERGRESGSIRAEHHHLLIEDAHGSERIRIDRRPSEVTALPSRLLRFRPVFAEGPGIRGIADGVLALALSAAWPEIGEARSNRRYQITLAYALPLWLDPTWREWTARNLRLVLGAGQMIAVPSSEFIAVDPAEQSAASLAHRQRRLLKRHVDTTVEREGAVGEVVDAWSAFCRSRFDIRITPLQRKAVDGIFGMSGCEVRQFVNAGRTIARSLVCLHASSRTLFDVLAPWDESHAYLRPGIYSAFVNLLEARDRDYRYCLCYGDFPYKRDVLGRLGRLRLQDLRSTPLPPPAGVEFVARTTLDGSSVVP